MSFWTRERTIGMIIAVITLIITLILIAVLDHGAEGKVAYDCVDPTERERIRDLALKGIDDGLQGAMTRLFEVWQKDPTQDQPARAQVGTTNAINAHSRARKYALAWQPPVCPPEKN